jgi:hypothetical protein
MMEEYDELIND